VNRHGHRNSKRLQYYPDLSVRRYHVIHVPGFFIHPLEKSHEKMVTVSGGKNSEADQEDRGKAEEILGN
jgi:hypothetical protein